MARPLNRATLGRSLGCNPVGRLRRKQPGPVENDDVVAIGMGVELAAAEGAAARIEPPGSEGQGGSAACDLLPKSLASCV
jgi:hypothetical protein